MDILELPAIPANPKELQRMINECRADMRRKRLVRLMLGVLGVGSAAAGVFGGYVLAVGL